MVDNHAEYRDGSKAIYVRSVGQLTGSGWCWVIRFRHGATGVEDLRVTVLRKPRQKAIIGFGRRAMPSRYALKPGASESIPI